MAESGGPINPTDRLDPLDHQSIGYTLQNLMAELSRDIIISDMLEEHTKSSYPRDPENIFFGITPKQNG